MFYKTKEGVLVNLDNVVCVHMGYSDDSARIKGTRFVTISDVRIFTNESIEDVTRKITEAGGILNA
jgi:hypothetical protein